MIPDEATALLFLEKVWAKQTTGGYGFLPFKHVAGGWWCEGPVHKDKVTELPQDGHNVYFSVNRFSTSSHTSENCLSGRWLHGDLDAVDPRSLELKPTVAWETSPGRFQALWLLAKLMESHELEELNRALTYRVGADKGGWSRTKLLRIPGTVSHKRKEPFVVKLLWANGKIVYTDAQARDFVGPVEVNGSPSCGVFDPSPLEPVAILHGVKLPAKARMFLRATETNGRDRSKVLYRLEKALLRAGLTPGETVTVVRGTVWNKHSGRQTELQQLCREVSKAQAEVEAEPTRGGTR